MLCSSEEVDVFDLYDWLKPSKNRLKKCPKLLAIDYRAGPREWCARPSTRETIKTERELQNAVAV